MKISGIKSKLLLAFVTVLVIITGLNVGLAIYLINQQGEREAFASLTRQTVLLQNELQETIIDLRAIAEKNVVETGNLSDLATIYAQTQQLTTYPEQAAKHERGLLFNKIISLNRLQVVLQTADFSSAAVYIDNALSHYVTTTEAGMSTIRVDDKPLIKTGQNQAGDLEFDNWPNWVEGAPSPLVTPHITPVSRATISFDFTAKQMVVLQIVVPVQAITQTVMRDNITLGSPEGLLVNDLSIATPETLSQSIPGQNKPVIIGAFVFKKVFGQAFLEEVAQKTGLLPALYSPDGIPQIQVDGQQALFLAQELRPDLILMDRWMPVLDGFEAARQIRQNPELAGLVVIAVSASVSKEDQAQSREVGINAFLPKPVHWPNLAALLEEHLQLEWKYQEQGSQGAGERILLRPPAPFVPPPEEMAVLYDLALRGDMRGIRERAAHIETLGEQYVPFSRKLRELAQGFEERELLALVVQSGFIGDNVDE